MPAAPSEPIPVARQQRPHMTAAERAELEAVLFGKTQARARRRLLPEFESECNDAMLAEIPWRR